MQGRLCSIEKIQKTYNKNSKKKKKKYTKYTKNIQKKYKNMPKNTKKYTDRNIKENYTKIKANKITVFHCFISYYILYVQSADEYDYW